LSSQDLPPSHAWAVVHRCPRLFPRGGGNVSTRCAGLCWPPLPGLPRHKHTPMYPDPSGSLSLTNAARCDIVHDLHLIVIVTCLNALRTRPRSSPRPLERTPIHFLPGYSGRATGVGRGFSVPHNLPRHLVAFGPADFCGPARQGPPGTPIQSWYVHA
jgi:hypothetical protein